MPGDPRSFRPGISGDFIRSALEWAGARVVVQGDKADDLDITLYSGKDDPEAVVGELVTVILMLFLEHGAEDE